MSELDSYVELPVLVDVALLRQRDVGDPAVQVERHRGVVCCVALECPAETDVLQGTCSTYGFREFSGELEAVPDEVFAVEEVSYDVTFVQELARQHLGPRATRVQDVVGAHLSDLLPLQLVA